MSIKDTVKTTIQKLETLCKSYEKDTFEEIEDIEETVTNLSNEVQTLDLASDQILKKDLNTLQSALAKLNSVLKTQQEAIGRQVQEIHLHQRALLAYAMVANNNWVFISRVQKWTLFTTVKRFLNSSLWIILYAQSVFN